MAIGNWSEGDLRRFIRTVLTDPAMSPKDPKPLALDKLAHLVLQGPNDYQQYQVKFGTLGTVTSDVGGWLTYTIDAFPTTLDAVIAMNMGGGSSTNAFLDIQVVNSGSFKCFINAAGVTANCMYIAIGH